MFTFVIFLFQKNICMFCFQGLGVSCHEWPLPLKWGSHPEQRMWVSVCVHDLKRPHLCWKKHRTIHRLKQSFITLLMSWGLGLVQLLFWLLATICQRSFHLPGCHVKQDLWNSGLALYVVVDPLVALMNPFSDTWIYKMSGLTHIFRSWFVSSTTRQLQWATSVQAADLVQRLTS